MSWSIHLIGTPANIAKALDAQSEKLTGDSKTEYDAAKPALQTLLAANVNLNYPLVLDLSASGHATKIQDRVEHANCHVSLQSLNGQLV